MHKVKPPQKKQTLYVNRIVVLLSFKLFYSRQKDNTFVIYVCLYKIYCLLYNQINNNKVIIQVKIIMSRLIHNCQKYAFIIFNVNLNIEL